MRHFINNDYIVINTYIAGGIKQENMKVYNKLTIKKTKKKI